MCALTDAGRLADDRVRLVGQHVDILVEVDVVQVRIVNGDRLLLNCRHEQEPRLAGVDRNAHVGDLPLRQRQAVELLRGLDVPEADMVARSREDEVGVVLVKVQVLDLARIICALAD